MNTEKVVIILTGPLGSGKSELTKFLTKLKPFEVLVFSDYIKSKLHKENKAITRENMQIMGNLMRKQKGSNILAVMMEKNILNSKNKYFLLDGARNPSEINHIKKCFENCLVVGITASSQKRYELIVARGKKSDAQLKRYQTQQQRDLGKGEQKHGQQVQKCMDMADIILKNEGTLKDLEKSIRKQLLNHEFFIQNVT